MQQAQGIAKSGAEVLSSMFVLLSPPKTNFIRFCFLNLTHKNSFWLASVQNRNLPLRFPRLRQYPKRYATFHKTERMKLNTSFLLILFLLINCSPKEKKENGIMPEIFRTNYGKINDKNLKLKFGELIEFQIQNQKISAVVLDIKQENNENWFGLCFLNNNQLFGRKIPQGFGGECINLYDLTFINENGLSHYKIVRKLQIDFNKVGFGSDSPVINVEEILRDYIWGINQRKKSETPCEKKLAKLNPTNECYFPLNQIE